MTSRSEIGAGRPDRRLEDEERQGLYRLLIALLRNAPDAQTLAHTAAITGDGTRLGTSLGALASEARRADADTEHVRFHELFIGFGGGTLSPYASVYRTGSLHDRPLIEVREDMARLGIARVRSSAEPEDHAVTLLEIQLRLDEGELGQGGGDPRTFFNRHVVTWMPQFFVDLAAQEISPLFAALGRVGRAFLDSEAAHYARAGGVEPDVPKAATRRRHSDAR